MSPGLLRALTNGPHADPRREKAARRYGRTRETREGEAHPALASLPSGMPTIADFSNPGVDFVWRVLRRSSSRGARPGGSQCG